MTLLFTEHYRHEKKKKNDLVLFLHVYMLPSPTGIKTTNAFPWWETLFSNREHSVHFGAHCHGSVEVKVPRFTELH